MAGPVPVQSSLTLQLLYHVSIAFSVFWWISEVVLLIWKDYVLPMPSSNVAVEAVILTMMVPLEAARIFFGFKGNLTERKASMIFSLLLTVPTILIFVYFIVLQTYVLRAEFYLGIVGACLEGLQILLGIIATITFARNEVFH